MLNYEMKSCSPSSCSIYVTNSPCKKVARSHSQNMVYVDYSDESKAVERKSRHDMNEIRKICHDTSDMSISRVIYQPQHQRYDPGISYFTSIITPVSKLNSLYTNTPGAVEFRMRRKNKTVILQWEPFTGCLAASGVAYLTVVQTICNTPPYPVSFPIFITYKGVARITTVEIDPHLPTGNIRFYLNTNRSSDDTHVNDSFTIPASSVSWIVD